VWTAGILFGVGTAYTRMAADRHYFTDVLAGAGIGTAIGAGIPLLFHSPVPVLGERARFVTTPVAGGHILGISGSF
jgi:membrane-associated phospholipid phosphatase